MNGFYKHLLRGPLFDPSRQTPMHDWAIRNGAVFEDVGRHNTFDKVIARMFLSPRA